MNQISLDRLTYGCFDAQTLRVPDRFLLLNVKLDQSVGEEKLEKEERKKTHQLKCFKSSGTANMAAAQGRTNINTLVSCLFQDLIKNRI